MKTEYEKAETKSGKEYYLIKCDFCLGGLAYIETGRCISCGNKLTEEKEK